MKNILFRFGFVALGVVALLGVRVMTDRNEWIISNAQLMLESGRVVEQSFTADSDDYFELEIEVNVSISDELRDRYIVPTHSQSDLDVSWWVKSADSTIASGDARDYLFVEGARSTAGQLRRLIMQIPYGRDEEHWNSFGLVGSRTISRGIGKFRVSAGETYTVAVASGGDYPELQSSNPTATIRLDQKRWDGHYKKTRLLGYSGLLLIAAGLAINLGGLFWRLTVARQI